MRDRDLVHSATGGFPVLPAPTVKEAVLFPMYALNLFVESQMAVAAQICFRSSVLVS